MLPLEVRTVGSGRSFGSIHVQTDDIGAIERAVRQFVPRLPGGSNGSIVAPPRHGWIAVYDDVCDRDPSMLRRLARELSERTGAVVLALGVEHEQVVRFILFEAGRIVDEYLSVPEHYGALPPGDVIALAANPRVVARLTGADPAEVRAVARTAPLPEELPPPQELLAGIAAVRSGSRALSTAGPTLRRSRTRSRCNGSDHALRRRAVPVLCAGPDRARREGRAP